jgi:DNA-binding NarL/FixJ family response regulator
MIGVLVADDNPIVRAAMAGVLAAAEGIQVVAQAHDGREALALALRLRPAVTLLDYRMPVADGLSVVSALAERTAVLVVTSDSREDLILSMLSRGARGYLVHGQFDANDLVRAVGAVAAGRAWLCPDAAAVVMSAMRKEAERGAERRRRTERAHALQRRYGLTLRERDILAMLSLGLSNAAIAHRLQLAEKTVKNHLSHIFAKLAVSNRAEARTVWAQAEWSHTQAV